MENLPGISGEISRSVNATLTVAGWENNRQIVEIEGLTANQNGVVGLSQDISTAERETVASAELYICGQADGSFTVAYGGDKPTYDRLPLSCSINERRKEYERDKKLWILSRRR